MPKGSTAPPSIDGSHSTGAHTHRNALVSAVRSLFSRRPDKGRELRGFELSLLASFEAGRCPVCAELENHDDHYFFWLLTESYQEIGMQEQVARSLGFCPRHGRRLLKDQAYGAAATSLHRRALDDLNRRLSIAPRASGIERGPAGDSVAIENCPGCASRDAAAGRLVGFLAGVLNDPDHTGLYGRPGVLCHRHFSMLAPRLEARSFERVLAAHAERLGRLGSSDRDEPRGIEDSSSAPMVSVARLLVSTEHGVDSYPPVDAAPSRFEAADPVVELADALSQPDKCPVCTATERAWSGWMGWLDGRAAGGVSLSAVGDLLPTCPLHVAATLECASASLSSLVVANVLAVSRDRTATATRFLADPRDPNIDPEDLPVIVHLRTRRERFAAAVEVIGRDVPCAVCDRLRSAADRTLQLLFALLHQERYRVLFEQGYGLCFRHWARAEALSPPESVARTLRRVELAKLALLRWESEEYLRKYAWSVRPERRGAEQAAPQDVVRRFSGTGLA